MPRAGERKMNTGGRWGGKVGERSLICMSKDSSASMFRPVPRDFDGHPMPQSVPEGLRLTLSRAPVVVGREDELGEWMSMLNGRYQECVATLPAERAVFEATFRHVEVDGSTWIYHVALMGEAGCGLDESNPVDADHAAYSRRVKEPGWEELEPMFMLTPDHLRDAMVDWGRNGEVVEP